MTHVASVMYSISGTVLGEKPPADVGTGENGPDSLKASGIGQNRPIESLIHDIELDGEYSPSTWAMS
jgi:hypothetical protein